MAIGLNDKHPLCGHQYRKVVHASLSNDCHFVNREWTDIFMVMIKIRECAFKGDYMVPLPRDGFAGACRRLATSTGTIQLSRIFLESLFLPVSRSALIATTGGSRTSRK